MLILLRLMPAGMPSYAARCLMSLRGAQGARWPAAADAETNAALTPSSTSLVSHSTQQQMRPQLPVDQLAVCAPQLVEEVAHDFLFVHELLERVAVGPPQRECPHLGAQ